MALNPGEALKFAWGSGHWKDGSLWVTAGWWREGCWSRMESCGGVGGWVRLMARGVHWGSWEAFEVQQACVCVCVCVSLTLTGRRFLHSPVFLATKLCIHKGEICIMLNYFLIYSSLWKAFTNKCHCRTEGVIHFYWKSTVCMRYKRGLKVLFTLLRK